MSLNFSSLISGTFKFKFLLIISLGTMAFSPGKLPAQCPTPSLPDSIENDIKKLSLALTEKAKNEYDKACLIFNWIRSNIRYDNRSYKRSNTTVNSASAAVLKRKSGVCLGYSNLFRDMCAISGLTAVVVEGHSKQGNRPPKMEEGDHAWNAVKIDDVWYLLDVTWAADTEGNKYFQTPPEVFIIEHLPIDPMWQLLKNPVSPQQFKNGILPIQKSNATFAFSDSINVFLELPIPIQKITTSKTAYYFNPTAPNKRLYAHACIDYALSMGIESEKLQITGQADSLTIIHNEMLKYFRLAANHSKLYDWQIDQFANTLINEAVNISSQLQQKPTFPEAKKILQNMKTLLLEAKSLLQSMNETSFPTQTLQICEEYLKWVDSYWD